MKCPISKTSKSGRMKTGVDRHATEAKVKVKKSLASGIEKKPDAPNDP
jgi:hypothetical protein